MNCILQTPNLLRCNILPVSTVADCPGKVWIKRGICSADSIINILLCVLGYIPGLIHAWYIILKFPEPDWDDPRNADYEPLPGDAQQPGGDGEGGRVTYYYVSRQTVSHDHRDANRNYGSVNPPTNTQDIQPPVPEASRPQQPEPGSSSNAAGESRPPPTYAEAVKGDHKVQSQD